MTTRPAGNSTAAALRESGLRPGLLTQIDRLADELTAEELEQAIAPTC